MDSADQSSSKTSHTLVCETNPSVNTALKFSAVEFRLAQVTDVLWTLTDRCNLKCIYCYAVPHCGFTGPEPTRDNVDRVLQQLQSLSLLDSLILSGGEALLSPHIEYVLQHALDVARVRYLITNGTTVRSKQKQLLRLYRPRVMVTIDSLRESENATTRGSGVLTQSLDTLKWLLEMEFFTIVIIVLTRFNAEHIAETIEGLYDLGVRRILIQQLHCPTRQMADSFLAISPSLKDVRTLNLYLDSKSITHPDLVVDDNEICFFEHRRRVRRRKCLPDEPYLPQRLFMCGAGYSFFALKTNGDVIPCNALLDCVAGNIYKDDIESILLGSTEFRHLRNLRTHRVNEIPGCADCPENPICDGGCRADVFNLTGEIGNPHPFCPRISFYTQTLSPNWLKSG